MKGQRVRACVRVCVCVCVWVCVGVCVRACVSACSHTTPLSLATLEASLHQISISVQLKLLQLCHSLWRKQLHAVQRSVMCRPEGQAAHHAECHVLQCAGSESAMH
jgi:hypothetical protein